MSPVRTRRTTGMRLVVCLGSREAAGRLLEESAELARRLEAELVAAFVEDRALLCSAALPFTRVVTRFGIADGGFEPASVRRALRLLARELEQRTAELARRFDLLCRFIDLGAEAPTASLAPGDVLLLTPSEARRLLESEEAPELPAGTCLVLRDSSRGPVVAISGGDETTRTLLSRLASAGADAFLVHLAVPDAADSQGLERRLREALAGAAVRICRERTPQEALNAAARDIIQEGARLVVLDGALAGIGLPVLVEALQQRSGSPMPVRSGSDEPPSSF